MRPVESSLGPVVAAMLAGCVALQAAAAPQKPFPAPPSVNDGKTCCGGPGSRLAAIHRAGDKGPAAKSENAAAEDMVWVPGGEFRMGSDDPLLPPTERPAHQVRLDGFWIDPTEVTNADFQRFTEATGYKTLAERPVDWEELKKQVPEDTPKPDDALLQPGSLVFVQPRTVRTLEDYSAWWQWTIGANWRHPEGPGSDLKSRDGHPVVHVAWEDALAYCSWAGKRLPSEAEWEFAARGGLAGKRYILGDDPPTGIEDKKPTVNAWDGEFPTRNNLADGFLRTAPVKTYPPNTFGLYDMAGNVWEWCSDWYRADAYERTKSEALQVNPQGPHDSWDPREPLSPKRVIRGGSFLCHESYCESYRPAARRGQSPDTGMSHLGFRCARSKSLRQP